MRTVHTEPTPVGWLKVGDRLMFDYRDSGAKRPYFRDVTDTYSAGRIGLDGMWSNCSEWSKYPLVVSDHSETSLFAPDGALF